MKNRTTKLQEIIKSYFKEHDDYYEAKEAFINDVNEILKKDGDKGIICKNLVDNQVLDLKNILDVEE